MTAIDWEQMPYFLALARHGSLRAAADDMGTTHGKIGRHLAALEGAYGVQLFRRTKSGLSSPIRTRPSRCVTAPGSIP